MKLTQAINLYNEQRFEEAIVLFEELAAEGNACALNNLALMLQWEQGCEQDLVRSFELLTKSAEQKDPEGQVLLGTLYEHGYGVINPDHKKAMHLYLLSANSGNVRAQYNLGDSFHRGLIVNQDLKKACGFYSLASKQGDVEATYKLGTMYEKGEYLRQDYSKAVQLYELILGSVEHPWVANRLGNLYRTGNGCEQNLEKAFNLFQSSADANIGLGLHSLGFMYNNGEFVEQDYSKAFELYTQAYNLGEPYVLCDLAALVEEGNGCEQNLDTAYELYKQAAEIGYETAINKLKEEKFQR